MAGRTKRFGDAGVKVVAVVDDPPAVAARIKSSLGPSVTLLSNADNRVKPMCGLNHCQVVLDRKGAIRWGGLDENWRSIRVESVLQAAYRLR